MIISYNVITDEQYSFNIIQKQETMTNVIINKQIELFVF